MSEGEGEGDGAEEEGELGRRRLRVWRRRAVWKGEKERGVVSLRIEEINWMDGRLDGGKGE